MTPKGRKRPLSLPTLVALGTTGGSLVGWGIHTSGSLQANLILGSVAVSAFWYELVQLAGTDWKVEPSHAELQAVCSLALGGTALLGIELSLLYQGVGTEHPCSPPQVAYTVASLGLAMAAACPFPDGQSGPSAASPTPEGPPVSPRGIYRTPAPPTPLQPLADRSREWEDAFVGGMLGMMVAVSFFLSLAPSVDPLGLEAKMTAGAFGLLGLFRGLVGGKNSEWCGFLRALGATGLGCSALHFLLR